MSETDDFLIHFGVKGMKWGKRKKYTESKREYKSRVRDEKNAYEHAKINNVLEQSMKKGEKILVKTQLPNDYVPTIMTGKQFVQMAAAGGAFNARTTDIFATRENKQFVLNNPTPDYTPTERR